MVGFGESIAALFNQDNVWISRGIAAGVIFMLLGELQSKKSILDELITQKVNLKHTQTFRPCHMVFCDGSGLSHDGKVT